MTWSSRLLHALVAPVLAALVAAAVGSGILAASGHSPWTTLQLMAEFAVRPESIVSALNRATPYFLAGTAVAVGFRMNLFNIGVEGQYRLAAMAGAVAGAAVHLPMPLHLTFVIVVASLTGAAWAGIAAYLKVVRDINEVISTLLLNYVATAITAYLLAGPLGAASGSNRSSTAILPDSAHMPSLSGVLTAVGLSVPGGVSLWGFILVAAAVGTGIHYALTRTWYGFQVRAMGLSASAAEVAGIRPKRAIFTTMLLSDAIAGLVGLPFLLGQSHSFGLDFPAGIGFTGIAVALLGRNNILGIAAASLFFGVMERSSQVLDLEGIPKEIVTIMQGVIVLVVVIAYEVVRRVAATRTRATVHAAEQTELVGAKR